MQSIIKTNDSTISEQTAQSEQIEQTRSFSTTHVLGREGGKERGKVLINTNL